MAKSLSEVKKNIDLRLSELREKRRLVIANYKKKLEDKKIEKIKNKLLGL